MKNEFIIRFASLKDGKHLFSFKIETAFFEEFDYSDIEGADVVLEVVLEKKPTMMVLEMKAKGSLKTMCDKCTDSLDVPIKGKDEVIYKFTDEHLDDEKIISILPNEIDIDISIPVFEFLSLLLPIRRIHSKGKCNQEMLNEIDNYLIVKESKVVRDSNEETEDNDNEIDPRWASLKKLK
jgi:uncharacterized metal-binding protein YceD (DUF177 family)